MKTEIRLSRTDLTPYYKCPVPILNRDQKRVGWVTAVRWYGEFTVGECEIEDAAAWKQAIAVAKTPPP